MNAQSPMSGMFGIESMLKALTDNWWLFLIQGVASVIFGILVLVWPGETLVVLIAVLGWFVLVNGVLGVIFAIASAASSRPWGWKLTYGILGVLIGLLILRWPGLTALTILFIIGFWAIMVGITEIVGSIADRGEIPHAGLLGLEGVISLLFGIAMLVWPGVGLLTVALLVGIYALIHGILYCVIAFRVRALGRTLATRTPPAVTGGGATA